MSIDPHDFLSQAGSYEKRPSYKWANIGDTLDGVIAAEPRVVETDDLRTGTRTNKLVVDVDTADGPYAIWLASGTRLLTAVADAYKEAGAPGLQVGGHLKIKYHADGEPPQPGYNAPKLYKARYTPPVAPTINLDEF